MPVTDDRLREVARKFAEELYETAFRGKDRGRYCLTRAQVKAALNVEKLHATTIEKLQEHLLEMGVAMVDLDDLFPVVSVSTLRNYRRPPTELFQRFFPPDDEENEGGEEAE